jgi:hypothetical protein
MLRICGAKKRSSRVRKGDSAEIITGGAKPGRGGNSLLPDLSTGAEDSKPFLDGLAKDGPGGACGPPALT